MIKDYQNLESYQKVCTSDKRLFDYLVSLFNISKASKTKSYTITLFNYEIYSQLKIPKGTFKKQLQRLEKAKLIVRSKNVVCLGPKIKEEVDEDEDLYDAVLNEKKEDIQFTTDHRSIRPHPSLFKLLGLKV